MGDNEFTKILGWPGYRVYRHEIDEAAMTLRLWVRRKRGYRKLICSGCGRKFSEAHDCNEREVRDLRLIVSGLLLLAGLWTPVVGTLVAGIEVWKIFLLPENLWIYILLGTLGAPLAMLGPGTWSVDARLFGWKRISIRDRQR